MRMVCWLALAVSTAASGDVPRCQGLQRHGKLNDAANCYQELTRSHDAFERAEGYFGLQRYDDANNEFREADKLRPNSAVVKAEWARLYHEHTQPGDAANLYEEAIEADANYAPAYLGMARVLSENYDKKAVELAQTALQRDPKLFEGHEFLAYLALEDGQPAAAAEEAKKALALNEEALDGLAVLACIDWLSGAQSSEWMDRILKINPAYGEAYAMGAHFFLINYRYDEAVTFYRKALELNGGLWAARSQLGVNLLRLGFDEEAKQQLGRCYEAHFRDPETVNSLRLLDTLKDYETFKTRSAEVRLNKKEAALLLPYIQPELERAVAMYDGMYKTALAGPVRLEVYPNHEDFVVRTIGLPGQGGLLGVTFGTVVAIDSPSARPPGHSNWADTLWHELNHVYVIAASNKLVPRWFAEGVAVHEEGVVSRDWGDRLTPDIVAALKEKKLLSVVQLDRGFVRPEYQSQVLVSYYEAGKMCDYIVEKWGDAAILGIIHSYAARKTTAQAIESNLQESPEAFDKNFLAWLEGKTKNTVQHFDEWQQALKAAHAAMQQGKTADALKQATAVRDYYPDYVGDGSAYELLAECDLTTGNKSGAVAQLEQYRDRGGSGVETLKKLAELEKDSGQPKQASATLEKLNFIYPEDAEVHRALGKLLLSAGEPDAAVREYRAELALNPADVAESHFELANALHAAHKTNEAKEEVLIALEAAPNFKPAQQLLLQLSQ
jgi:cellulose synthase operon protein C